MKFSSICIYALAIVFAIILFSQDVVAKKKHYVYPRRPAEKLELNVNAMYYELVNGASNVDWTMLDGTLEYVKNEYDCADFRLVNLIRILYEYGNRIPEDYRTKIEDVLFNFRYWWDEPGENSMCYWSENHQILFASAEYLIGQLYPETVFPSSGLTGKQKMEKARIRACDWLEMRWNYGFIEYNSNVYYKEDIGPLINLIDFAKDEALVQKCKIVMDLLFYDIALQTNQQMFISVSGRAYQNNRTGINRGDFGGILPFYWGDNSPLKAGIMYGMSVTNNYTPPAVFKEIATSQQTRIIKQSNGLDLIELKDEGYYGTDNRSMMMQWGMEAFSNPIIIRNSLEHIRNCRMFSNDFLKDFKMMDVFILDWLHLEPLAARILNPQTNGVAIQRGNTYTYHTKDYSIYTVQKHQVGDYGDQQHIFGMNIKNHFSIFHMHPARKKESKSESPNYWTGYGHFPHAVQDENVNLSIYKLPKRKGPMEADLLDFTRAYFPQEKFDKVVHQGNYIFGKKEDTYCAMISHNALEFLEGFTDDLIQQGKKTFWITEAGSKTADGSFDSFIERISNNPVAFDTKKLELTYTSNNKVYHLDYNNDFKVNGEVIDVDYKRYDSPYTQAKQKDKTISIAYQGESLFLDFDKLIRKF